MYSLIAKFVMVTTIIAAVGAVGAVGGVDAADAATVKRHRAHIAHPNKKSPSAVNAPKPEKLVMAPGGVMVPRQAPAGQIPGFMDDGASKRRATP